MKQNLLSTRVYSATGSVLMAIGLLLSAISAVASITDFSSGLMNYVSRRWGRTAVMRLYAWKELDGDIRKSYPNMAGTLASSGAASAERIVLGDTNKFFDRIPYYLDKDHWGVPVYWATPVEFLSSNGGDCVDYSLAKYFTLKDVGVPVGRLRMTYVRAIEYNEAHMVLAYYPTPDSDPLILDNLITDIRQASQRTDLEPVYSFNDDDLWVAGGVRKDGGAGQIRLWQDLIGRIQAEIKM